MSWFVPRGTKRISNNDAKLIKQAFSAGAHMERKRIFKMLDNYLELTHMDEDMPAPVNEEWDNGFQAAMPLIQNPYNNKQP